MKEIKRIYDEITCVELWKKSKEFMKEIKKDPNNLWRNNLCRIIKDIKRIYDERICIES
jgi:hypothetical protein